MIRQSILFLFRLAFSAAIVLIPLEGLYRFQWVDLFGKELINFNSVEALADSASPTVLVFGDSFTAGHHSYVSHLSKTYPRWRWINTAISGSGVKESLLVAPKRFSRFKPRVVIYQIYVGNDLIDMGYHPDWRRLSVVRNLWWTVSGIFPSIPYCYRRLREAQTAGKLNAERSTKDDAEGIDVSEQFSPERYTARVPQYYRLDPTVTDDSIRLQGVRRKDFQAYVPLVRKLMANCAPPACRPVVFVIPHKIQLNRQYFEWNETLGAIQPEGSVYMSEENEFLRELREALSKDNIPVLNPLPELRNADRQKRVYYVNDDHLNPHGHAVLAKWLSAKIGDLLR